jgi:hypothetical protein
MFKSELGSATFYLFVLQRAVGCGPLYKGWNALNINTWVRRPRVRDEVRSWAVCS